LEIAAQVDTVERLGQLADRAAATLADLGYDNVRVLHGDGPGGGWSIPRMMPSWRPAGDPGPRESARPGTGPGHARFSK